MERERERKGRVVREGKIETRVERREVERSGKRKWRGEKGQKRVAERGKENKVLGLGRRTGMER